MRLIVQSDVFQVRILIELLVFREGEEEVRRVLRGEEVERSYRQQSFIERFEVAREGYRSEHGQVDDHLEDVHQAEDLVQTLLSCEVDNCCCNQTCLDRRYC